jgi:cellobiose phosphorylase
MNYGYFDDAKREYVITNPRTPVKWINYIGTLAFGGFVDQTGGALICRQDPALNRITKYISQMPSSDFKGETLYLRINQPAGYRVFSPYFVPTLDPYDLYECHIGLGYTRLVSEFYGVRTDLSIFVPIGENRVIRDIKITNVSAAPMEVDAVPVVEYTHPDSLKQLTNADWVPQTMVSRVLEWPEHGEKILVQYPFMLRDSRVNYFTSNQPISSFDSDRKKFLGDNEYGTWAMPSRLQQTELSDSQALRGDNIGALMHHLGILAPGETRRLITQLGQAEEILNALPRIRFFHDERNVEEALEDLGRFWDEYLGHLKVETPDAAMNRMLNIHNPRQCHTTKNWSRYLSLYQLGYGARGIGFRDSAQDVMGVLANMPQEGKALIQQLLQVQLRNGSAMHQFNPLTMVATMGDASEREDLPQYYSDDHLWVILATCAYMKETGDLGFLEQVIPYYEKDKREQPLESGTVLDHLKRAIQFTRQDVGAHGLPLLGFADWNDTINLRAGAESLFTANLYGKALLEMIELAKHRSNEREAEQFAAYYDEMKQRVNQHAWDGEWYIRYFDFDGTPLGSHTNPHGQIYINGQSWPVLSGFATPERARLALDSLRARLNTQHGIKISTPGFDGFDATRGGITTYPPGAKENGGIFLHTNPWVMIAETLLGNGERAFEYYNQINPASENERIEEYECEPYVYAQNILGDEHPQFGLARNSWLSGTAAWMYLTSTQYILGVRPTFEGLMVDPCIPKQWQSVRVTRRFRNAVYNIVVSNPVQVCKGVRRMSVDGKAIEGSIAPIFGDDATHHIQVVMA